MSQAVFINVYGNSSEQWVGLPFDSRSAVEARARRMAGVMGVRCLYRLKVTPKGAPVGRAQFGGDSVRQTGHRPVG